MTESRRADDHRRRTASGPGQSTPRDRSHDQHRTGSGSAHDGRPVGKEDEPVLRAQRRCGNRAVARTLGEWSRERGTLSTGQRVSAGESTSVSEADRHRHVETPGPTVPTRSFDALGSGRGLPLGARSVMEDHFGADLGDVRLHTDGLGVVAAGAMDVPAFAVGRDVVVRPSRVDPASRTGRSVLAHEVAHVLQQGAPGGGAGRTTAERDATAAADGVTRGERVAVAASTDLRVAPQDYTGSHAVTPEQLFEILRSWRGHTLSGGAATVTPEVLAEAERLGGDVPGSQQELGPGYKTTAVVAISDAEGNRLVDYAAGTSDDQGHAETHALADLRRSIESRDLGPRVQGGHVMVVVDQSVCVGCRIRLASFVEEYDLATVRAHTFTREKLRGSGQATPKTSMRGTTRRYFTAQPPLRQQLDWRFVNPAFSGPGGTAGQRQTELFLDPGQRRSGGSGSGELAGRRSGSADDMPMPRQRTLFQYAREMNRQSDVRISAPPIELDPGVRFVRFIGRMSDLLAVYDGIKTFIEALDMASGLAAGQVVILTETASALRAQRDRIESHADRYDAYSEDLRRLESTLVDVANSNDLDAIWDTETDVGRLETKIHSLQSRLEVFLLADLQATKQAIIDKRLQIDAAMQNRSFMSLLGMGGSTAPHAKLVAYRADLIKLTGILSGTISAVERTIDRMERDREYLLTWEDWLGEEYVRTLWDLEAQEESDE